jgi:hypothetical protein
MTLPVTAQSSGRVTRLANRAVTLTLLTAFSTLTGLVTFSSALAEESGALATVAGGAPLAASLGAGVWTCRTRVRLRWARAEESASQARSPAAPVDASGAHDRDSAAGP